MNWFNLTIICRDEQEYQLYIEADDMAEALATYKNNAVAIAKRARFPDIGCVVACRVCYHVLDSRQDILKKEKGE
jgi:hypothetical protein